MRVLASLFAAALGPSGDGIELRWDAPTHCPAAEDVRRWLDADEVVARTPLGVHVKIEARAGGYRLSLSIDGPLGRTERRLEHADCSELARTAAFIVAVEAEPLRSLAPPPAPPRPQPAPDIVAPIAPPDAPSTTAPRVGPIPVRTATALTKPSTMTEPRSATAALRAPLWYGVGLEGGVAWGIAPRMAGTLGGALALGGRYFRVSLGALHTFVQPARYSDMPSIGAEISNTRATLRGCGRFARGRVALSACGGLELGASRGRGFGAPVVQTQRAAWVAVTLHAMFELVLARRLALLLGPMLVVPLTRPAFRIRELQEPVWRGGRVGGGLFAGLELRLGRGRAGRSSR